MQIGGVEGIIAIDIDVALFIGEQCGCPEDGAAVVFEGIEGSIRILW